MSLEPPFGYYGGKRRVTEEVWSRLAHCKRYIEPFCGGLSMLLGRPGVYSSDQDVEIVNDKDGLVVNLWRAIQNDPDTVIDVINRPGSELDLHSAARKLKDREKDLTEQLRSDIDFYDAELAALWLWGTCFWKGSDWPSTSEKKPKGAGEGILSPTYRNEREEWVTDVSNRLQDVVILCDDWSKCVNSSRSRDGVAGRKPIAFFLDPPYSDQNRADNLYNQDDMSVTQKVKEWCLEHQDNPHYRIVLCEFDGIDMPDGWSSIKWSSRGTTSNKQRERIWFSPHCLDPDAIENSVIGPFIEDDEDNS